MMWPLFSVQLSICLLFKSYCKSYNDKSYVFVFSLYTVAFIGSTQNHSCWLLKFSQKDMPIKKGDVVCVCVSACVCLGVFVGLPLFWQL